MQSILNEDQRAIQENVQSFLAKLATPERLRSIVASPAGWDEVLWTTLAQEMGYAGLLIPEEFGGAGAGALAMALVLEELGRRLAIIPFFETAVLSAQAILHVGTTAQKNRLLPAIAAGELKATLANANPDGDTAYDRLAVRLARKDGGWRLDGAAGFAPFAFAVDLLLVVARSADGLALIALPASTEGVTIMHEPPLDLTRPFASLHFVNVPVEDDWLLGEKGEAERGLRQALAISAGLLASEQTGGAAFCLESTVEYAQQRVQFGRIIGSFQAVKHELADMMLAVEAARSASLYAANAVDEGGPDAIEACSVAKAWCSEAYRSCAGEAIQLHGGIGFTWEHHAHFYFKRAWSSARWLGEPADHYEKIAGLIGLGEKE